MRPDILNYLFKTISTLPGIGPKFETLFNKKSTLYCVYYNFLILVKQKNPE